MFRKMTLCELSAVRGPSARVSIMGCDKRAVILGHLDSPLGIGRAAEALWVGLSRTDWSVERVQVPDPWSDPTPRGVATGVGGIIERACVRILAFNADHARLMSGHPLVRQWKSAMTVGVWHWELEVPPRVGRSARRLVDEVWVASRFVERSLERAIECPVVVVPPPVVPSSTRQRPSWWGGLLDERFVVLVVFDYRSNVDRKNPYSAVEAFRRAFEPDDGAVLLIKCRSARFFPREHRRLVEAAGGRNDIVILDDDLTSSEMAWLIKRADVLLSLHRAEGFGLPLAEAASVGTVVVATGYGGPVDFLSADEACLIPFRLGAVGPHHWPYPVSATWAEPDVVVASEVLRRLRENPREVSERGRRLASSVRSVLSVEACAERLQLRLDELASRACADPGKAPRPSPRGARALAHHRGPRWLGDRCWAARVGVSRATKLAARIIRR